MKSLMFIFRFVQPYNNLFKLRRYKNAFQININITRNGNWIRSLVTIMRPIKREIVLII